MIRKQLVLWFISTFILLACVQAQTFYPTNWFTGLKDNNLQLMIKGDGVAHKVPMIKMSAAGMQLADGMTLKSITRTENPNYIFLNITIAASAKPGVRNIQLGPKDKGLQFKYELVQKNKANGKTRTQGVSAADFVYLLMPDRFANGDPTNDVIPGYRSNTSDRNSKYDRHGGDFKGIENNFGYLKQLGITTIWMTPILENNVTMMHEWGNNVAGYHGYWFTDHYEIDKRFGGNDGYKTFCDNAHKNGFKVIQDAVFNHINKEHWIYLDPPAKDWINNWPAFQGPNHREEVLFDPYASAYDKKIMLDGWFVDHLPDLNQRNPELAKYLIQHAIWTTETYGIDSWRVDTYKYCDENFMNEVNKALYREFPQITILGEAWVNSVVGNAYFTQNNINNTFKHNANGIIDFQACFAMLSGMNRAEGWMEGVNKLYTTLAQDIVYKNPMNNMLFLDNHDMDRVYSVVGEDWGKFKMGMNWLLTLRGIPQVYYGTEILMKNFKNPNDAMVREDFPGGWASDKVNKFTAAGRTPKEDSAYNYISKLANFRKNATAITQGKLMQYIPANGLYVYYRYNDKQSVVVLSHTGKEAIKPNWVNMKERVAGFTKLKDVVTGRVVNLNDFELQPGDSYVMELLP